MEAALKKKIIDVLMELNPKEIAVFGSYARGEQREDSDIDILIEYHEAPTLFDIAGMIYKFELLNIEIDIVDKDGSSKKFIDAIEKDKQIIFRDVRRSA